MRPSEQAHRAPGPVDIRYRVELEVDGMPTWPSPALQVLELPWKVGDPAAPSGTATLLRLHPRHESHLRQLPPTRVRPPASRVTCFHGVTGGVYKARERIHRGSADPRLLATPPSCRRVSACNPNRDAL